MKNLIISSLKLSDSEKAVLNILEKQKLAQTVSKIARSADIPRTTTDYILRKFLKWKIARKVLIGRSRYWLYNKMLR